MALSDFQNKKLVALFENIYDTNKDGVIDKVDFEEALEKVTKLHNWGKDEIAKNQVTLDKIWEGLRAQCDINNDGKVQKNEWIKMYGECIKNVASGKEFPAWQNDYMEFMFYANDTSGDGFIDEGEYAEVYKLFGFPEANLKTCFSKISEGCANNMISKDDFKNLWKEYLLSNDESQKGNFLFGTMKH